MKLFDWVPPLVHIGRSLERIAVALEVIVREAYGISLSHDPPDLSLEISYTDVDEDEGQEDASTPPRRPGEAIGEDDYVDDELRD